MNDGQPESLQQVLPEQPGSNESQPVVPQSSIVKYLKITGLVYGFKKIKNAAPKELYCYLVCSA